MTTPCPCQSTKPYTQCCARYIESHLKAPTPEALMRSRYTAYTLARIDYIAQTQLSPAADNFSIDEAQTWAQTSKWLGLEIHQTYMDEKNRGFVEFTAHFKINGRKQNIHELSEFHQQNGRWFYVSGQSG